MKWSVQNGFWSGKCQGIKSQRMLFFPDEWEPGALHHARDNGSHAGRQEHPVP